jgi:hypothetical protein
MTTEHQNTTKINPAALFSSATHYPILPPHVLLPALLLTLLNVDNTLEKSFFLVLLNL